MSAKLYAVAISPDGALIAAGGWTRDCADEEQIYLFDRASGALVKRIDGLPNVVYHLTFSPDGRRLAATLELAVASGCMTGPGLGRGRPR